MWVSSKGERELKKNEEGDEKEGREDDNTVVKSMRVTEMKEVESNGDWMLGGSGAPWESESF